MLFIADGRFHLEAAMIANPKLKAYRYDPYGKVLTEEGYEFNRMVSLRDKAITDATKAEVFGVILGTLGRQGNPAILYKVLELLRDRGKKTFVVLLSEIFPAKLDMMPQADAWVQIACPRLSIDWGHYFTKPILSPYELYRMVGETESKEGVYEMDFYEKGESNYWSNFGGDNAKRGTGE
jgi:2-(3-amino-3-carboxypropyl)histidine synthase